MEELIIECETYNNMLYTKHENRIKTVILKNAKNIDIGFFKKDGSLVTIETTPDCVESQKDKLIIKLNDDDVSERWYGEW